MVFVWKIILNEFISSSHFTLFSASYSGRLTLALGPETHEDFIHDVVHVHHVCKWTGKTSFPFLSLPAASHRSHDGLSFSSKRSFVFALLLPVDTCSRQIIHQQRITERMNSMKKKDIRTQIYTTQHNAHWIQTEQNECNRNHQMSKIYDEMCERICLFRVCVILSDIVVFLLLFSSS